MDNYGVQLRPIGQNSIIVEYIVYSRELSVTGIQTITGTATAKTT